MDWSQLNWDCAAGAAFFTRATDKAAHISILKQLTFQCAALHLHSSNYGTMYVPLLGANRSATVDRGVFLSFPFSPWATFLGPWMFTVSVECNDTLPLFEPYLSKLLSKDFLSRLKN